jgi:ParB family chromosome partitioning protein
MRDLFEHDDGGCSRTRHCSTGSSSRSSGPKRKTLRAEGWKWIAAAPDFPYAHTARQRRLHGEPVDLTDEERAAREALSDSTCDLLSMMPLSKTQFSRCSTIQR